MLVRVYALSLSAHLFGLLNSVHLLKTIRYRCNLFCLSRWWRRRYLYCSVVTSQLPSSVIMQLEIHHITIIEIDKKVSKWYSIREQIIVPHTILMAQPTSKTLSAHDMSYPVWIWCGTLKVDVCTVNYNSFLYPNRSYLVEYLALPPYRTQSIVPSRRRQSED